jgi:deoxyribonuclease-1
MIKYFSIILALPLLLHAGPPRDFYEAKKTAFNIFEARAITLYCTCNYNAKKQVNLASCNMTSAKSIKRARRIEWEHMMPAENFGNIKKCAHINP